MRATHIHAWSSEVNLAGLSAGLGLTRPDVLKLFENMRFATWLAQYWGMKFLPFEANDVTSVHRSFKKSSIKFQDSRRVGTQRTCNVAELRADVRKVGWFIVSDFRGFPEVDWYMIPAHVVVSHVENGIIGVNGVTPDEFDAWIGTHFRVSNHPVSLYKPNVIMFIDALDRKRN